MGADIHMYIEYSRKPEENEKKTDRPRYWMSFSGRINPGRNYTMFALLAQVRGTYKESLTPKGRLNKEELGYASGNDLYCFITDEKCTCGESNMVTLEDALRYTKYGEEIFYRDGKPIYVSNPDWHSHSWLTAEELSIVFEHYKCVYEAQWGDGPIKVPIEYQAILQVLQTLEDNGKNDARVVFWFDN